MRDRKVAISNETLKAFARYNKYDVFNMRNFLSNVPYPSSDYHLFLAERYHLFFKRLLQESVKGELPLRALIALLLSETYFEHNYTESPIILPEIIDKVNSAKVESSRFSKILKISQDAQIDLISQYNTTFGLLLLKLLNNPQEEVSETEYKALRELRFSDKSVPAVLLETINQLYKNPAERQTCLQSCLNAETGLGKIFHDTDEIRQVKEQLQLLEPSEKKLNSISNYLALFRINPKEWDVLERPVLDEALYLLDTGHPPAAFFSIISSVMQEERIYSSIANLGETSDNFYEGKTRLNKFFQLIKTLAAKGFPAGKLLDELYGNNSKAPKSFLAWVERFASITPSNEKERLLFLISEDALRVKESLTCQYLLQSNDLSENQQQAVVKSIIDAHKGNNDLKDHIIDLIHENYDGEMAKTIYQQALDPKTCIGKFMQAKFGSKTTVEEAQNRIQRYLNEILSRRPVLAINALLRESHLLPDNHKVTGPAYDHNLHDCAKLFAYIKQYGIDGKGAKISEVVTALTTVEKSLNAIKSSSNSTAEQKQQYQEIANFFIVHHEDLFGLQAELYRYSNLPGITAFVNVMTHLLEANALNVKEFDAIYSKHLSSKGLDAYDDVKIYLQPDDKKFSRELKDKINHLGVLRLFNVAVNRQAKLASNVNLSNSIKMNEANKSKLFTMICDQPDIFRRIRLLEQSLNPNTTLGRAFYHQNGLKACSPERGTLKKIAVLLQQLKNMHELKDEINLSLSRATAPEFIAEELDDYNLSQSSASVSELSPEEYGEYNLSQSSASTSAASEEYSAEHNLSLSDSAALNKSAQQAAADQVSFFGGMSRSFYPSDYAGLDQKVSVPSTTVNEPTDIPRGELLDLSNVEHVPVSTPSTIVNQPTDIPRGELIDLSNVEHVPLSNKINLTNTEHTKSTPKEISEQEVQKLYDELNSDPNISVSFDTQTNPKQQQFTKQGSRLFSQPEKDSKNAVAKTVQAKTDKSKTDEKKKPEPKGKVGPQYG